MLDLIEQANLAYDQREEWCSKLQALKARAERDLAEHTYVNNIYFCTSVYVYFAPLLKTFKTICINYHKQSKKLI